jgi:hypothetical protein
MTMTTLIDPTEVDPCPMERLAYEFASVAGQLAGAWKDPETRKLLVLSRQFLLDAFDDLHDVEMGVLFGEAELAAE